MSWDYEQNQIVSRFANQTLISNISWDGFNGPVFSTPDVDPDDYDSAIWARPSVDGIPGSARPMGLGEFVTRYREGLIIVQHFAPRGAGESLLRCRVDETNRIFHRQRFGEVRCRDADEPERIGFDPSGEWYQINAIIPFYVLDDHGRWAVDGWADDGWVE